MTVLNFGHPLRPVDRERLLQLAGDGTVADQPVTSAPLQLADGEPVADQVRRLLDGLPLTVEQWQTEPMIVNLPGLSVAAAAVLAEVHGRRGGFPRVLRWLRDPAADAYVIAEVVDLQATRDEARARRVPP